MRIAVIGTGNVGSVLGRRWGEAGYDVVFGSRAPDDRKDLAAATGASIVRPSEAVNGADVVLLAVPGRLVEDVVEDLGDLAAKIVIDPTNSHRSDLSPKPAIQSLAERIAERAPDAHVVKAFNTTGAKNMDDPSYPGGPLAMPYCGDDADAKAVVAELISVLGFEAIDNGRLAQAYALEGMALVWIGQAYGEGWGPDFGFRFVRRDAVADSDGG